MRRPSSSLPRGALFAASVMAVALVGPMGAGCTSGHDKASSNTRVIVLGFDGMDYALTKEMIARGRLPHLARLAAQGTFQPLGTSTPPQSPVAWSNFITGMDAGGHGIFDFIHRDPPKTQPVRLAFEQPFQPVEAPRIASLAVDLY